MKKPLLLISFLFVGFLSIAQTANDFVFDSILANMWPFSISSSTGVTIDWGDGTTTNVPMGNNQTVPAHSFSSTTRTVIISGSIDSIVFNLSSSSNNNPRITQWGSSQWKTTEWMFFDCLYLDINASDTPDLSLCNSMAHMFHNAGQFNDDINNWDVSNITDMSDLFYGVYSFNQALNNWDVSSVTDMSRMFLYASNFNQPLSNWDTANVINMGSMFQAASSFNSNINNWDVSNVSNISHMFYNANSFNQDISNWDVSNVNAIDYLFYRATSFNQNISNWDVSNITNMDRMFTIASSFNQNISSWDVSNVTSMIEMFEYATSFNQPIDNWDVSNVTIMQDMFVHATSFNQNISSWDVSNVTDMDDMFYNATSFNQPLNNWDFNQYLNPRRFVAFSGLDTNNYDKLLQRFVNLGMQYKTLNSFGLTYCDSFSRNILLQNGWSINGDSLDLGCSALDNQLQGSITYDFDNNGCDPNDLIFSNVGIEISNGTTAFTLYTDINGDYSIPLSDNTYTVTPIIDTNLFTTTPASATFTAANQNITTQDFCLTATTPTDDLEITIIPLEEARPGFDTNYKLVYKNKGNTQLTGNIAFTYDDDFMDFVSANPVVSSSSVGNLNWSFSNLDPFETREIDFTLNMNTPTDSNFPLNSNDIISFTASITPSANDATPIDNVFNLDQTVVNSYDPNDKTCLQGETIEPSMVGEFVHYRIRFENEGTASAINVRIVDYIDTSVFDISTLTPVSSSHDYLAQITDGNKLEFIFDNINLPNTAPASQGYILFKIKTVDTLVLGDTFSNQAGIYFDFNFPIITNLETTTVAVTLSNNDITSLTMSLFPNPANDTVTITSNVLFDSCTIYDLRGMLISSKKLQQPDDQYKFNIDSLASGMYMIQINNSQGSITQRLIVE
ncbi:conserved hypothetical protein [Flavobacteria bacterium BBFL7]|nr:conserved hypothetical protein [Flavobacteria bacterium BBFL7]